MDLGVISVRYARALLKGALEKGMEDAVYNDMQCIANCYLEVPELRATIDNPMLPKDKKRQLLFTAAGTNPTDLTERFLTLVIKERRANALQFMATSYITLYRQHKHIIVIRVCQDCTCHYTCFRGDFVIFLERIFDACSVRECCKRE